MKKLGKGPFLLIGAMGIILVGGIVVKTATKLISSRKHAETKQEAQEPGTPVALTLEQLTGGQYYIKDGDSFYALTKGWFLSSNSHDTAIPKEANPETRIVGYSTKDEGTIPELWKDGELIYKAPDVTDDKSSKVKAGAVPDKFTLERFRDNGWTIGIWGLSNEPDGGKYKTVVKQAETFYPGSSVSGMKCTNNDTIIIDKIGGVPLSESNVTPSGTITGLSYGETYHVDAYSGTTYIGLDAVADTKIMASMEVYNFTDYSMAQDGYMVLSLPEELRSGYYMLNGSGMFKFTNRYRSEGDTNVDYNAPYYMGKDDNGNMVTNPENGEETAIKKDGTVVTAGDTGSKNYGNSPVTTDDFSWQYELTVDNPQKELTVTVSYSDAAAIVGGQLLTEKQGAVIAGASEPSAILTAPDGTEYPMEHQKKDDNALKAKIENPGTGTWIIKMKGLYARTFDVSSSLSGTNTNMIVKNGSSDVEMTVYLENGLQNGTLKFIWENTEHAATFEFKSLDGSKKYGNKVDPVSVTKETYGEVDLHVGALSAGEYKIRVSGESLGHVRFSAEDAGQPATETGTNAEAETLTEEETTSAAE